MGLSIGPQAIDTCLWRRYLWASKERGKPMKQRNLIPIALVVLFLAYPLYTAMGNTGYDNA